MPARRGVRVGARPSLPALPEDAADERSRPTVGDHVAERTIASYIRRNHPRVEEEQFLHSPALPAADADDEPLATPATQPSESDDEPDLPAPSGTRDAPRERVEWQTMFQSALRSEVLRSETKRIISVDSPEQTRTESMYQRWIELRAYLRNGSHTRASSALMVREQQLLHRAWPRLLDELIDALLGFNLDSADHEDAFSQVSQLLDNVDRIEQQFPSARKMVEVSPRWGTPAIQDRLAALYSWYNCFNLIRVQLDVLRRWTGSDTLQVQLPPIQQEGEAIPKRPGHNSKEPFVERLLKDKALNHAFEKRTLRYHSAILTKARDALVEHHDMYAQIGLPSFQDQVMQLANFPVALMEGVLKVRLSYELTLRQQPPSLMIIDSFILDVRSALALACKIKDEYAEFLTPSETGGWDPPCSDVGDDSFDATLKEALVLFFNLLDRKLKVSAFFKETEILEPEWLFLSTAAASIKGGDIIVANRITRVVTQLFTRIEQYFRREIDVPVLRSESNPRTRAPIRQEQEGEKTARRPTTFGGLTTGHLSMNLREAETWIRAVAENVRIRSRRLLAFSRDIRGRLDNAAEYDLASLPPTMPLPSFLGTLQEAGFFLVHSHYLFSRGIYVLAMPSLHDQPELVLDLLTKCLRSFDQPGEPAPTAYPGFEPHLNVWGEDALTQLDNLRPRRWEEERGGKSLSPQPRPGRREESKSTPVEGPSRVGETTPCRYLLLLSLRDDFLWTGEVMALDIPEVDIQMHANRLRLVADGSRSELQRCKDHLYGIFANPAGERMERSPSEGVANANRSSFPLETVAEYMAHIHSVQKEVAKINQGIYKLAAAIIVEVPKQRKRLRFKHYDPQPRKRKGGDVDELIQNLYQIASEHALRSLPFIVSAKVRAEMTVAISHLSIDWISFITDDCVPTDRRTFKWAVTALEHASISTMGGNILKLEAGEYALLQNKVGICIRLLISHFDILGARSSMAAKARENAQKHELDQLERKKAEAAEGLEVEEVRRGLPPHHPSEGAIAANLLNSQQPGGEERRLKALEALDEQREEYLRNAQFRGRVLDDSRIEDRGLQSLAQSSCAFHWQVGQVVGSGTFGTVYSALDLDTGHMMAVKEIKFQDIASHPAFFQQIKDEMTVMQLLDNINVVQYYGIEVHRDKVYIFEEYCEGGSLAHLLEMGPINDERVIQFYALQMLDGLAYLHGMGIVHRDIKPENILMDPYGVIKYVDFGAAKILANNPRTILQSGQRKIMRSIRNLEGKKAAMQSLQGTPMYMSPESINPELMRGMDKSKKGAMDIWSVGCVVLECVTGERPWKLDNEWAIMYHIGLAKEHPPLPNPSQLSKEGIDFIAKCLTIDPNERPTAEELRSHPWILSFIEDNAREMALEEMEGGPYVATPSQSEYSDTSPMPATPGSSYLGSRHGSGSSDFADVPLTPHTPAGQSGPGLASLRRPQLSLGARRSAASIPLVSPHLTPGSSHLTPGVLADASSAEYSSQSSPALEVGPPESSEA